MTRLLLVGSVTRDFQQIAQCWAQPGGAPWHVLFGQVALGQGRSGRGDELAPTIVAGVGPWVGRCARPALLAAGARWEGRSAAADTVFVNRFRAGLRSQELRSTAPPNATSSLPAGPFDAAVAAPLFPSDLEPSLVAGLARRAGFVALDVQGLLRGVDPRGRVRLEPTELGEPMRQVHAVKFSAEEFSLASGAARWRAVAAKFASAFDIELVVTDGSCGAMVFLPERLGGGESSADGIEVGEAVDTSGAGDLLIATYAVERARGRPPAAALAEAADAAAALLRRRQRAQPALSRILPQLRRLEAAALVARRRRARSRGGAAESDPQAVDTALRKAIESEIGGRLEPAADTPEDRASAVLSGAWALLTQGWPVDLAPEHPLSARGLARAVEEERALLEPARARRGRRVEC